MKVSSAKRDKDLLEDGNYMYVTLSPNKAQAQPEIAPFKIKPIEMRDILTKPYEDQVNEKSNDIREILPKPYEGYMSGVEQVLQSNCIQKYNNNPHYMNLNSNKLNSKDREEHRRQNHKEVERKRREGINNSINTLATLVPGVERNKGAILIRTINHIRELRKENDMLKQSNDNTLDLLTAIDNIKKENMELKRINEELKDKLDFEKGSQQPFFKVENGKEQNNEV